MLRKLGSICGKPLHYVKCTLARLKLGYAKILVEMDATGDFLKSIDLLNENGNMFHQLVVYEWRPRSCIQIVGIWVT